MTRRQLITASLVTITITAAALARAAAHAQAPSPQGRSVTLTGKVIDAACYMIHPPAATIPSHKDCSAACLARGVPLAIANEADNALYFPADGNKQLMTLLDQRVRVTGTTFRKNEPMELKMAVGDTNQMAVRVDGGYNVVTVNRSRRCLRSDVPQPRCLFEHGEVNQTEASSVLSLIAWRAGVHAAHACVTAPATRQQRRDRDGSSRTTLRGA